MVFTIEYARAFPRAPPREIDAILQMFKKRTAHRSLLLNESTLLHTHALSYDANPRVFCSVFVSFSAALLHAYFHSSKPTCRSRCSKEGRSKRFRSTMLRTNRGFFEASVIDAATHLWSALKFPSGRTPSELPRQPNSDEQCNGNKTKMQ